MFEERIERPGTPATEAPTSDLGLSATEALANRLAKLAPEDFRVVVELCQDHEEGCHSSITQDP